MDEALVIVKAMKKSQLKPSCVTYTILIGAICQAGRPYDAKKIFSRLFENGLQPNVCTYSILLKGFCKEGLLDEAYTVFRGMAIREQMFFNWDENKMRKITTSSISEFAYKTINDLVPNKTRYKYQINEGRVGAYFYFFKTILY